MVNHKKKYQEIADRLIEESFLELRDRGIVVFELKFTKLYGLYIPFFESVGIGKVCRGFFEKELVGILAHELCHAELAKGKGFWKKLFLYVRYLVFPWVRRREERRVDELVIELGYAKELALLTKGLEKDFPEYSDGTYMSSKNIITYAKEIGKW